MDEVFGAFWGLWCRCFLGEDFSEFEFETEKANCTMV